MNERLVLAAIDIGICPSDRGHSAVIGFSQAQVAETGREAPVDSRRGGHRGILAIRRGSTAVESEENIIRCSTPVHAFTLTESMTGF